MIAVDILKVELSHNNNQYLLVAQDYFTKWPIAIHIWSTWDNTLWSKKKFWEHYLITSSPSLWDLKKSHNSLPPSRRQHDWENESISFTVTEVLCWQTGWLGTVPTFSSACISHIGIHLHRRIPFSHLCMVDSSPATTLDTQSYASHIQKNLQNYVILSKPIWLKRLTIKNSHMIGTVIQENSV